MNISYKWLKRYIDPAQNARNLTATLTALGLECDTVEEVESIRGGLRGIVIGKVLTCEDHPDSDHLHVTTVDLGTGEPVQIVCGAPNVAAGQTVVVATVGTTLYDGDKEFQIKKSKIRGKESFGMICAEDEIGVGTSHDGIIVIEEDVKPGTSAAEYFNVESDYVLEVELTPNRVDAASHYGVARDLKARKWCDAFEKGLAEGDMPEVTVPDVSSFSSDREDGAVKVTVDDRQGCPRYSGVTIRNVDVKESPEWLRNLLIAIGQRPINNIVDITNFILNGIGQPLHCFDLAKVKGEHIVVRTCPAGTKFTTLDGVERELNEADLMICDEEGPMCIAGVFGGLDSGVTESTKSVFIESAYFNPTRVRRTARRHGLSTDASFRYERGTDPNVTVFAAKLAAVMIKELAGGEICGDVTDFYPEPVTRAEMDFSFDYCNKLIGKTLPQELIICILKALEFDVERKDADTLRLKVPTYRVDVYRPCDVVEEILRVYGYNNVEFGDEMHVSLSQRTDTDADYDLQQLISEQLTAMGFMEIMNNSLSAVSYYEGSEKYPLANCVRLLNPLSQDLSVMRQTLLYGGLESISHNVNRKETNLKFYEFGNVYRFDPTKESTKEHPLAPYSEHESLALWMTGDCRRASWNVKAEESSVYDLRGVLDTIFRRSGVSEGAVQCVQGSDEIFAAKLDISSRSGKYLGSLGILRSTVTKHFDIDHCVVYAELDWSAFFKLAKKTDVKYTELPKTQPVERDLALLVDKGMKFSLIEETVRKTERKLLRDVTLFDVYEGKNLPEGKKSYAIKIFLQDNDKTLTDKQIEASMGRIVEALRKLGAELR